MVIVESIDSRKVAAFIQLASRYVFSSEQKCTCTNSKLQRYRGDSKGSVEPPTPLHFKMLISLAKEVSLF